MPKISVIIPAYNASATVLETIHSVQIQTFSDFEIVVVDDGSTDNTLAILQSINDERLRIISSKNGGVASARNLGISQAVGDFISFLDADDLWTPQKLELQLDALLKNPSASVAYSFTESIDEYGTLLGRGSRYPIEGNVYAKLLLSNFLYSGSNPLVRKTAIDAIGGFDRAYAPCEDWNFYLRLAARYEFVVVPRYQILYRQLSNSMSAKVDVMRNGGLFTIDKGFQAAPPEYQFLKRKSIANFHKYCACLNLRNTNDIEGLNDAAEDLSIAFRLDPMVLTGHNGLRLMIMLLLKILLPKAFANNIIQTYRSSPLSAKNTYLRKRRKYHDSLDYKAESPSEALV